MEEYFDVIVYNIVLLICGKANKCIKMEKIWKYMKGSGNVGIEVIYYVLVCTFVRCGRYDIVIDVYGEMF